MVRITAFCSSLSLILIPLLVLLSSCLYTLYQFQLSVVSEKIDVAFFQIINIFDTETSFHPFSKSSKQSSTIRGGRLSKN